jgi:hypothetical protein
MTISYVAMERVVQRTAASDAVYRAGLAGRPLRSDARRFSDEDLTGRLRSFGIDIDRSILERWTERCLSAEEIARGLLEGRSLNAAQDRFASDWVWICLDALWQRWFPEKPSFEGLDDKMQAGYELKETGGASAACPAWLQGWNDVTHILDKAGIESVQSFDERFGGTQSLFNWNQDLESELWNAGLKDRQFLTARVAVGEEWLRRFANDDRLIAENWRRAIGESYCKLGDTDRTDALYREWLAADPRWGWGWIGWSDCYTFPYMGCRDPVKAEKILREGLSVRGVRSRRDLVERLADLGEGEANQEDADAPEGHAEAEDQTCRVHTGFHSGGRVLRRKTTIEFGGRGLPLSELPRLGRVLRGGRNFCSSKSRTKRAVSLRERQEVQEVLRRLLIDRRIG